MLSLKPGEVSARCSAEQREVGDDREQADRERAGEELADVGLRDAARDEGAEPAGADIGGDRRDRDVEHHGVAHAVDDDRQRDRQLDVAQALQRRHAHAARRLAQRRVDIHDRRVGVADDRQLRIEDQRDHRRQVADALADQRQDRDQQAEQRDRRDRHDHRRDVEHAVGGGPALGDQDADRDAGHDRDRHGDARRA